MFKMKLLATLACLSISTLAHASDYPLSGQDTVYHSYSSPSSVSLRRGNSALFLQDGHAYRLRFSNSSSSFHIMPGDGSDNEFKIQGGFPGGNLRDFSDLDGSKFGNPGVEMSASTNDGSVLSAGQQYSRSYSCQYSCGTDTICNDVPEQVCRTDRGGHRTCTTTYHRECSQQTRFCSGTEYWNVQDVTTGTVYKVSFTDSNTNAILGSFDGTYNVTSSTQKLQRLSTTCPN